METGTIEIIEEKLSENDDSGIAHYCSTHPEAHFTDEDKCTVEKGCVAWCGYRDWKGINAAPDDQTCIVCEEMEVQYIESNGGFGYFDDA